MPAQPADKPWIERVVANPALRSGYASLVTHVLVCLLLGWFASAPDARSRPRPLVLQIGTVDDVGANTEPAPHVEIADATAQEPVAEAAVPAPAADSPDPVAQEPLAADPSDASENIPIASVTAPEAPAPAVAAGSHPDPNASATAAAITHTVSARSDPARGKPRVAGGVSGQPFATRRGNERRESVRSRGGSAESEAAVERGLAWLALHQAVDGSWQFDLSGCRCDGACRDPGTLDGSTASTAIALLPFLGAGSTHQDGPYQETVSRGIYYLVSRMQPTPRGGDFCEGTMYGHGVTTLALAEALGMTKDDMLVPSVRDAVRFIETAQDMHGGGWRYLPGQAGDTTVTAWQLAALKSASLAGLETPSPTIDGVRRFLDRVQTQKGAAYGYRTPAAKPCTSAIGLLCRMYTGWGSTQEPLQRGLTNLAKPGPAPQAIYQNFYLSQALLQLDHPVWPRWNAKNRDQLVAQQARFGHETGSWFFADPDTAPGGRLAHTALAVLTLEVYYRLLPIYGEEAVENGF